MKNRHHPNWYELFDNKQMVDALLDRLQHHCITIRIDGPSLRAPNPAGDEPGAKPTSTHSKPNPTARRKAQ